MSKKHLLLVLVFLVSFIDTQAQFVDLDCPETVQCFTNTISIDIYEIDLENQVDIPCLDVESQALRRSLRFEATSPEIDIYYTAVGPTFDATSALTLREPCELGGECLYSDGCVMTPEIHADDLIVGQEYILSIYGCSAFLEVTLEISPGEEEIPTSPIGIEVYPMENCEQNIFCENALFGLEFIYENEVFQDNFNSKESLWHVLISGPENLSLDVDVPRDYSFSFEEEGNYIFCLDYVQFECSEIDIDDLCTEIEVVKNPIVNYETYFVCQHDLESGDWTPNNDWVGGVITEEGFYEAEFEIDCGCIETQLIEVEMIEEIQSEVVIELCPDDYPFIYFEDHEYDYSQFDIESELLVFNGSLIEDYDNNNCDSLVYLILINEDPEDRCSSCELPIVLQGSKIVYCVPFDNAAIDVSGKRNIVEPHGIDFDDNGSSNNILWDAVFDGDEDYVVLPHSNDLNTEDFALDFKFNKDEIFENGSVETLFSKGSNADNKRFEINLNKLSLTTFDLVATFYTENGNVDLTKSDMQWRKWYDITIVVDNGTAKMYHDGLLFEEVALPGPLKGNTRDLLMGTREESNINYQDYYIGRINDFKYWKEKLSAQAILFLHYPEKEFEVQLDYFLSCCEQVDVQGIIIDKQNPIDSLIIPNASPTGYDSVYILNFVENDASPHIDKESAPKDIIAQYQQQCNEFCQAVVEWTIDPNTFFSDNCNELTFTQTHTSPLVLDENISFVEVIYTATDDCGQLAWHTFAIELECLPSIVPEVPEQNEFETLVNGDCIDLVTNAICKNAEIKFWPGYLLEADPELQLYDGTEQLTYVMTVNGISETITQEEIEKGISFSQLNEEGEYEICIASVSSECETVSSTYCETIIIKGSSEINHGIVESCRDDIAMSLPEEISQSLSNLILSNPQETKISIVEADDCGCEMSESIELVINEIETGYLYAEICEGECFREQTEAGIYTEILEASNGCDSILTIELQLLPNVLTEIVKEICEGESYEGHTETGTYVETFAAEMGCDSMRTIQLNVLPKSYDEVLVQLCPDSTYMGYSEAGTYELNDTNVLGCDSITTLNIELLDALDPACFVSSINGTLDDQHLVYPNPFINQLYISDIDKVQEIEILSSKGKKVKVFKSLKNDYIELPKLESGVYILKVIQNQKAYLYKVIKM